MCQPKWSSRVGRRRGGVQGGAVAGDGAAPGGPLDGAAPPGDGRRAQPWRNPCAQRCCWCWSGVGGADGRCRDLEPQDGAAVRASAPSRPCGRALRRRDRGYPDEALVVVLLDLIQRPRTVPCREHEVRAHSCSSIARARADVLFRQQWCWWKLEYLIVMSAPASWRAGSPPCLVSPRGWSSSEHAVRLTVSVSSNHFGPRSLRQEPEARRCDPGRSLCLLLGLDKHADAARGRRRSTGSARTWTPSP